MQVLITVIQSHRKADNIHSEILATYPQHLEQDDEIILMKGITKGKLHVGNDYWHQFIIVCGCRGLWCFLPFELLVLVCGYIDITVRVYEQSH